MMQTNADRPDPIAAATAIVLAAAERSPELAESRGLPAPVIAMAAAVVIATGSISVMVMNASANPAWCQLPQLCR